MSGHDGNHRHMTPQENAATVKHLLHILSQAIPCPADAVRVLLMTLCEIGEIAGCSDTQLVELLGSCLRAKRDAQKAMKLLDDLAPKDLIERLVGTLKGDKGNVPKA